jgi:arylsulfatase A-like enzyme
MISKPQTQFSLLIGSLCCAMFVGAVEAAAAERPNIILLMADDLGWGDTGYHCHPILKTPHLDAMARDGLRFERFYSGAPVCSPTRGSCLTGRHPYRYGIFFANTGHLPPQEVTLAELLGSLGYTTGHFGKWHLGTLTKTLKESNRGGPGGVAHYAPPWDNGFDVCFSTEAKVPTYDPMRKPKGAGRKWWDPVEDDAEAVQYGTHYWTGEGEMVTENLRGDDSRIIMDRAVPFIRDAAKRDEPFFAVIWFHAPHLPVVAGPKYTARYKGADKYTQHYWGCISALDEQVGRLRAELKQLGVERNTMLWFASDNGPEGNDKAPGTTKGLRGRKRSLFEGGIRVPGLLVWPGRVKPGRYTAVPASTSDYLPTVLDLLGIERTGVQPLDGVSLLPLIEGSMRRRPEPIPFESAGQLALVDNRYKIVHQPKGRRSGRNENENLTAEDFVLFDIQADPAEKNDLAAEQADVVKEMARQLLAWRESCNKSRAGEDYR